MAQAHIAQLHEALRSDCDVMGVGLGAAQKDTVVEVSGGRRLGVPGGSPRSSRTVRTAKPRPSLWARARACCDTPLPVLTPRTPPPPRF